MITTQQIKELREKTGAGIADVKKALEQNGGDMEKAFSWIEQRLGGIAEKRAGRDTAAGIVESYIHSNYKVGVMLELFCETDFVAKNPDFKELAHDLAMQIAAMRAVYLSLENVPQELWLAKKNRLVEEAKSLHKPSHIMEEIVEGKLKAYFASVTLLEQPFVKDQEKTVGAVVKEAAGKFGENIKVGKFIRFEI